MDWREELAHNTTEKREKQARESKSNKPVYPVFGARQEEHQ